jgi:hypothetical protein
MPAAHRVPLTGQITQVNPTSWPNGTYNYDTPVDAG